MCIIAETYAQQRVFYGKHQIEKTSSLLYFHPALSYPPKVSTAPENKYSGSHLFYAKLCLIL